MAVFFASLLLVVGCGEQKSESSESPSEANAPPTAGPEPSRRSTVSITNTEGEMVVVRVEIATTTAERERGLMERTALAEDAGMLFVFDREQQLSFWMKDTLIPLSIAYINE
ncbi:MAG TPA: DUF192 domain-containing protein, partial [Rubrobacteraceae bacterium]|nr:DUF192 domain-containing protein [Rubrobacteraceae bacterium]